MKAGIGGIASLEGEVQKDIVQGPIRNPETSNTTRLRAWYLVAKR
jgi:hypothetical protein